MDRSAVPLSSLCALVGGRIVGDSGTMIADVTHDSREAGSGTLFVAVRGFTTDGHQYAEQAVATGASALCVEETVDGCAVPQLLVADTRSALPLLAAEVHGRPSEQLRIVGITGTNGKTTVAYLLESIVSAAGLTAGRIGTTGASIGGYEIPLPRTTPESSDFQRLLGDMVEQGVDVVAVEVSSHALTLGRVDAVEFAVAAFTNLSQDHLDFHGDMDAYFAAKKKLFDPRRSKRAVINVEDEDGMALAGEVTIPVFEVGRVIKAEDVELHQSGCRFRLVTANESLDVSLPLAGAFNVSNALVAAGCALELGMGYAQIAAGLAAVGQIPGRYELIDSTGGFAIAVDYAHTADGVQAIIEAARAVTAGRVIVVLGAGGDRDRSKRPAMGRAASSADEFVLTSDNPRSEPPEEIIGAVQTGVEGSVELTIEPDRRRAIRLALELAGAQDTVLVLGKGHEQGQEIAGEILEFDDRVVVREELAKMERTPC